MEADFQEEKQKGTSGLTSGTLSVEFMELDLSSLKSTLKFVEDFKTLGKPLHVLICNAGLGMHPLSECFDIFDNNIESRQVILNPFFFFFENYFFFSSIYKLFKT